MSDVTRNVAEVRQVRPSDLAIRSLTVWNACVKAWFIHLLGGHRCWMLLASLTVASLVQPAYAACPPIEVRISGAVTRETDGSTISNLPITIRMEVESGGLPSMQWDAVVTDRDGRYAWSKSFPRDPCREGNPILGFPARLWGWIAHPRNETYRRGANGLPEQIRLQTEHRSVPIPRSRLIDGLDPEGRLSVVTLDFSL